MTTRIVETAARKQSDKLLLKLADTAAKRMRLQDTEAKLKEANRKEHERIQNETRQIVLNRQSSLVAPRDKLPKRTASPLAPKPKSAMETKPKSKPKAQGPFREDETVEELVKRLKAIGVEDEQIEMEVEMKQEFLK